MGERERLLKVRPAREGSHYSTQTEEKRVYRRWHARESQRKKRLILQNYKTEKGCKECGYNEHACALDLDHRDPSSKKYVPSKLITVSWDSFWSELSKCDVLCSNCHRVKTRRNKEHLLNHETYTKE